MTQELTIIGGTGTLSTRVVRLLARRGVKLKIVARNPAKARGLFGNDVAVVEGDVEDGASLHKALRGSGAVYIHLNTETLDPAQTFYTEREGVQNIVAAAEEVGVTQLLQIGGIGTLRPDFFSAGLVATDAIRRVGMAAVAESRIPHTFLLCSVFLDSLPRFVNDGVLAVFGEAETRVHFTHTSQLAEHLFHAANNPACHGKSLPVQGREGVDFVVGARRFFGVLDPSVRVEQLPIAAIDGFGLPEEEAAFLKHVSEVMAGMHEAFVADEVHAQAGAYIASIEAFAEELLAEAS